MLKWAVTARGSLVSASGSGLSETPSGGETENCGSTSRAAAWPTYNNVSVASEDLIEVNKWSPRWTVDDTSDRDSLSAYDDNTSTLEQIMTIDFNDESQVCPLLAAFSV